MHVSRVFIERPVATSMVVAAIVIFGLIAFRFLPVNDLPNVDFPTISVTADLPGANPEVMAVTVARSPSIHRASGSGRSWNLTTFGRFSLPPSRWNIVRVE